MRTNNIKRSKDKLHYCIILVNTDIHFYCKYCIYINIKKKRGS